jgi:hypothetical protein
MRIGERTHFVFRPLGRWGLGLWRPDEMVEQEFSDAAKRGDDLPSRIIVLRRIQSLLEWEWRLGPWAVVRLPPDEKGAS